MGEPRVTKDEVQEFVHACRLERIDLQQATDKNRIWYSGLNESHYGIYDVDEYGHISVRRRPTSTPDEIRYQSYLATALVDRTTAAVGLTRVGFYGIPANNDDETRTAAHVTTAWIQYLKHSDEPNTVMQLRRECAFAAQLEPTSFVKIGFDPQGGDPLDVPPEVAAVLKPEQRDSLRYTGASWRKRVTWDNLLYPPGKQQLTDHDMIVEEFFPSFGELIAMFPKNTALRELARDRGAKKSFGSKFLSGFQGRKFLETQEFQDRHYAHAYQVWVKPGAAWGKIPGTKGKGLRMFPHGWMQIWVDGIDESLHDDVNPYAQFGIKYPYVMISQGPDPYTMALDAIPRMSRIRHQAPYLERMMSKWISREMHHARPLMLVPEGTLNMRKLQRSQPGDPIEFNPLKGAPSFLTPSGASPMTLAFMNELVGAIVDEAGVKGGVDLPKRIDSGAAIEAVVAQDMARMQDYHQSVDEGIKTALWWTAQLEAAYSVGIRALPILGRSQLTDIVDWTGAAMRGVAGVFRASAPVMVDSPAAEEQRTILYWQSGLISREDALDRLNMLPPEGAVSGLRQEHMVIARQENRMLDAGEKPVTYDFYDDDIHINSHISHFLQNLWFLSEDVKKAKLDHIQEHQARQMLKQMSMMQQQGQMQQPQQMPMMQR